MKKKLMIKNMNDKSENGSKSCANFYQGFSKFKNDPEPHLRLNPHDYYASGPLCSLPFLRLTESYCQH